MPLTWLEAKTILARFVGNGGVCVTNPKADEFTFKVLDYLLISGSVGNLHAFEFCAVNGCLTLPYELETPLKFKLNGVVGSVWDKWYTYHQTKNLNGCEPIGLSLIEDPNRYPTVYDLPVGGSRVGVIGTCDEAPDAHVIVKGYDVSGRQIITSHNGEQVVGEYLDIKGGVLKYTQAIFGKVTEVIKTKTVGYTPLYSYRLATQEKGFLADYAPSETKPTYRRFRFTNPACCPSPGLVTILGRIRLKQYYADNDLIPVENRYVLELAGQSMNAMANKDPQLGVAMDQMLNNVISKDNEYHRVQNGQPAEVFIPTSGGSIPNIVGYRGLIAGRGGRWPMK